MLYSLRTVIGGSRLMGEVLIYLENTGSMPVFAYPKSAWLMRTASNLE